MSYPRIPTVTSGITVCGRLQPCRPRIRGRPVVVKYHPMAESELPHDATPTEVHQLDEVVLVALADRHRGGPRRRNHARADRGPPGHRAGPDRRRRRLLVPRPARPRRAHGDAGRSDPAVRQRIVHHMVLGELVLRPIPIRGRGSRRPVREGARRDDDFVRVGAGTRRAPTGLAWMDLQRSGFVEHVRSEDRHRQAVVTAASARPFEPAELDPELAAQWAACHADLSRRLTRPRRSGR